MVSPGATPVRLLEKSSSELKFPSADHDEGNVPALNRDQPIP